MRPLKERPQNAVEKRNITSAGLDQLQDDNTTETELFNAPPVAAEVIVTAVMEGENTVSHVQSRKLPGIAAKSSVVNHDHSYMSEEKSWERPEPVDMSTQTDLTGEGIELLQRQTREMKAKLSDKEALLRDCFLENVIKSDVSVKHYTGLPSKPILDGLFSSIEADKCKLKYWSGKKSVGDMKYEEEGKKPGPKRKLSPYEEFILTLVRLRLGIVGFVLADLFGVSKTRVSQIFTTWISYMHDVFSPLIKWQSREKNIKYMPKSFKKSFPRTCAIIDCTEFFVQRPKTPTCQSATYSSYKHHNTFKCLVSITPSGAFNYISDLWSGNVSDRYITENSSFLDNIEPFDEVMADRGFNIGDLLTLRRATLNIPPFTHKCPWGKGKRLNASEVRKTRKIANLRIHVERAIQRLKCFKLLSNIIPLKLKPICNQMLKVAAFFCNIDKPLVKN